MSTIDPSSTLPDLFLSERTARDLGFREVQGILASLCPSPFGREHLSDAVFPATHTQLQERVAEVAEACAAVERKVAPDFASVREVRHILDAVHKGVVLGPTDILECAKTVDALGRLHDVITFQGEQAPRLCALAAQIDDERRFAKRVLRSFDEQGQLLDDASPELASARQKLRALRAEVQEKLSAMVRELDEAGYLRDRNFTLRNDRYVLPVKSEMQGRVDGIVHDASQTHQTVFVEPRSLLVHGNRIKIAAADVEQEQHRILTEMSHEVAELVPRLRLDLVRAGHIEATFALGTFAARTDGRCVLPTRDAPFSLLNARHPLLAWLAAAAKQDERPFRPVVGNDIALGNAKALVISGPNAGGKTVTLKTAGLVSLMVRAGFPVPVASASTVPLWSCVTSSIGDAQSLEGALSSFSGHLLVLRDILQEVETRRVHGPVLCLLDELCAGTDPAQGAALAQATLEHGVRNGARIVATTHFERLKVLGIIDEAGGTFRNASVALDAQGRPTFRLVLDRAGASSALEAAKLYGLPAEVVARAQELLSPDEKELQAVLRTLSEQRDALEAKVREAQEERERLTQEGQQLQRRLQSLEQESARLRREGKQAFLDELSAARRLIASAIEVSKGKDPRALNEASHALSALEEQTKAELALHTPVMELNRLAAVKVGDVVELPSMLGTRLKVLALHGDEAVVGRGAVKMRAKVDALRAPAAEKVSKKSRAHEKPSVPAAGAEPRTSENSVDVRGLRVEEGLELIDAFLDRMLRLGRTRAFILHGHGSGVMKKAIRDTLQGGRYANTVAPAEREDGGDAWTVVSLR